MRDLWDRGWVGAMPGRPRARELMAYTSRGSADHLWAMQKQGSSGRSKQRLGAQKRRGISGKRDRRRCWITLSGRSPRRYDVRLLSRSSARCHSCFCTLR